MSEACQQRVLHQCVKSSWKEWLMLLLYYSCSGCPWHIHGHSGLLSYNLCFGSSTQQGFIMKIKCAGVKEASTMRNKDMRPKKCILPYCLSSAYSIAEWVGTEKGDRNQEASKINCAGLETIHVHSCRSCWSSVLWHLSNPSCQIPVEKLSHGEGCPEEKAVPNLNLTRWWEKVQGNTHFQKFFIKASRRVFCWSNSRQAYPQWRWNSVSGEVEGVWSWVRQYLGAFEKSCWFREYDRWIREKKIINYQ